MTKIRFTPALQPPSHALCFAFAFVAQAAQKELLHIDNLISHLPLAVAFQSVAPSASPSPLIQDSTIVRPWSTLSFRSLFSISFSCQSSLNNLETETYYSNALSSSAGARLKKLRAKETQRKKSVDTMIQGEDRLAATLDDLINRVAMTKNMVQELLMRVDRSEISKW